MSDLKCNLSRKRALEKNLPQYCAFNGDGKCLFTATADIAIIFQENLYKGWGLITPMCYCYIAIPTEREQDVNHWNWARGKAEEIAEEIKKEGWDEL